MGGWGEQETKEGKQGEVIKIAGKKGGGEIEDEGEKWEEIAWGVTDMVMIVEKKREGGRDRRQNSLLAWLHSHSLQCTLTPCSA